MPFIQGAILSSLILNASFIICLTSICTWVYFWLLFYSSDLFVYFSSKAINYCCFIIYFSMLGPPSLLLFFSNFLVIIFIWDCMKYITYIWETLAVLLYKIFPSRNMVYLCSTLTSCSSVKLCNFPQTVFHLSCLIYSWVIYRFVAAVNFFLISISNWYTITKKKKSHWFFYALYLESILNYLFIHNSIFQNLNILNFQLSECDR